MKVSLKTYAIWYIGTMIALMIISVALAFMDLTLPSAVGAFVPAFTGAMACGQKLAREHKTTIPRKDAWAMAVPMTGVVVVIYAVIAALIWLFIADDFQLMPDDFNLIMRVGVTVFIFLVFAFILGLTFLANRYFLTMGANVELRALEKKGQL